MGVGRPSTQVDAFPVFMADGDGVSLVWKWSSSAPPNERPADVVWLATENGTRKVLLAESKKVRAHVVNCSRSFVSIRFENSLQLVHIRDQKIERFQVALTDQIKSVDVSVGRLGGRDHWDYSRV